MQVGIPMFFVYLLYRYRVPTLARHKKRCHQLRRLLETVNYESHGQMDELATFLNAEGSEELTYEQVPDSVLEQVLSYLDLSVATDTATDGAPRTYSFSSGYNGIPRRATNANGAAMVVGGRAARDVDPAVAGREALIDALLSWGGQQEERRLALAGKLKWESHDSLGLDTTHLTDHQKDERLAYDRCGFIFAMYHADTWWCEIADLVRLSA